MSYCDGWEVADKKLGVYAKNKNGFDLAIALKGWSDQVVVFTDGVRKFKPFEKEELAANEIKIVYSTIEKLQGSNGQLEMVILKTGEEIVCDAMFFVNGYAQQCDLAETFDCELSKTEKIITNQFQQKKFQDYMLPKMLIRTCSLL